MKNTFITILIILALCGAGFTVAYYTYQVPTTTAIDVLRDITDKEQAQPNAHQILSLYNLSGSNKWNGGQFLFSNITDVSYNPVQEVHIDAANQWLSNELQRDTDIQAFQTGVSNILAVAATGTNGRRHSSVYLPIAQQLITLSQSKAQRRVLLVYSDLMENEDVSRGVAGVSFYTPEIFYQLQSQPNTVKKLLAQLQALPSLVGIDVYLIYQPDNTTDDAAYRIVSVFYKNMLQEKGANVHITANLVQ